MANMQNNQKILDLARMLYGSLDQQGQQDILARKFAQPSGVEGVDDIVPMNLDTALGDQGGISLPQMGSLALGAAKQHPFKTAGLVGLGAGNIGGLTDNNKFGGQLGGLALGGLGSYLAGVNPYTAAMLTMGGGELGALFDKLRAKREQEQSQPLYGGR